MSENMVFRVRVFFGKTGRLALLSHLEVARALERAIRRASLPYAVSQGFSPHMKIAFGAALPVGVGGLKECFDLQLTKNIAPQDVFAALREVSVPDLMVLSCQHLGAKARAASLAYPLSTYRVDLVQTYEGNLSLPETVRVIRKKKEKFLQVSDYLRGDISLEKSAFEFSLVAHTSGSLRVDAFVASLKELNPGLLPLAITRIDQRSQDA